MYRLVNSIISTLRRIAIFHLPPHPLSPLLALSLAKFELPQDFGRPSLSLSPSPAEINFTCLMALALLNAEGERGRQAGYDGSSK